MPESTPQMQLLTSRQMASFVARGFLRLDGVVPNAINHAFLAALKAGETADPANGDAGTSMRAQYARLMAGDVVPLVRAGTPLREAYPAGSPLRDLLDVPEVAGAIASLVGHAAIFDHHFLHIAFPPEAYANQGVPQAAQHNHQDSTIDPRSAFDIQLMYYPHAVTADMGGTRYLPGSHLRIVSEAAIARYQNIVGQQHVVCPAGTVLVMHHGIWHGAGINRADQPRYMFKIRLQPGSRQCRLWDTRDLPQPGAPQRPIFWTGMPEAAPSGADEIAAILTRPEPWHEADTGRLEYINRVRLWRHLTGDGNYDADYWSTRIENDPR